MGRDKELEILRREQELSKTSARFTIVMGRRRIGKTSLIRHNFQNMPCLYILAKNEAEATFCVSLQRQIQRELGISLYGNIRSMRDIFDILFSYATENHLNLVIDEIQEFFYVRKSIFADMQELWDKYKPNMKINFITCGSIYSLMKELFEDKKSAMYGRMTKRLDLQPFTIATQKQIMERYYPEYTHEDLLCLYMLTGGVAKYIEILIDEKAYTQKQMLTCFTNEYMPFLTEGSDLINMEFRKEGSVYYSILSLIADGKNSSGEIDSILGITTSAYLRNLEINYTLLKKMRPVFASERSRGIKYKLNDNFLQFWFRFIYPNLDLVENHRSDLLLDIVNKGYSIYSGWILERYFQQKLREEERYTLVGNWWDSKGENEIDIVAVNRIERVATIAEVKINRNKISIPILEEKAKKVISELKRYHIEYKGYSLEDM
ncbi:MAG: ATP-binding protein [Bacteroides acidifaciens]|nr:ATP-binding protein [Bacteroides acidifaciens]